VKSSAKTKFGFAEGEEFVATAGFARAIFDFMTSRIALITLSLAGEPRVL